MCIVEWNQRTKSNTTEQIRRGNMQCSISINDYLASTRNKNGSCIGDPSELYKFIFSGTVACVKVSIFRGDRISSEHERRILDPSAPCVDFFWKVRSKVEKYFKIFFFFKIYLRVYSCRHKLQYVSSLCFLYMRV